MTALLDDLGDEPDPGERAALAAAVFTDVADLALVGRGCWSGTGRWLTRLLREADEGLAQRLITGLQATVGPRGDVSLLVRCGREEVERVGGGLDEGYQRLA